MKLVFAAGVAALATAALVPAALAQAADPTCVLEPVIAAVEGGSAEATFTIAPECGSVEVWLTSYRAPAAVRSFPQTLFASASTTVSAGESGFLSVPVPPCFHQVDLATAPALDFLPDESFPGWVAGLNGGTAECVEAVAPAPVEEEEAPPVVTPATPSAPAPVVELVPVVEAPAVSAPEIVPEVAPQPEAAPAPPSPPPAEEAELLPVHGRGAPVAAPPPTARPSVEQEAPPTVLGVRKQGSAGGATSTTAAIEKPVASSKRPASKRPVARVVVKGARRLHVPLVRRQLQRPATQVAPVRDRLAAGPRAAAAIQPTRVRALPYTGLPLWLVALAGLAVIALGFELRTLGARPARSAV